MQKTFNITKSNKAFYHSVESIPNKVKKNTLLQTPQYLKQLKRFLIMQ